MVMLMRILWNKSQLILVSTNMSEKPVLTQPKFIKVKDIQSARSGYNVYVKVISVDRKQVDTRDGNKIVMVNCVVADESAAANAFFKGDSAHLIEKDNVIAIRNGVKRFVKDHISLEIDIFGRVTLEKNVNIAATSNNNISDAEHKLSDKPRRDRRDNRDNRNRDRPRRENNRREGEDRPRRNERREPREPREPRQPREDRKQREPREPREQRQPRENQERREYVRRDNQERRDPPREQERRDPPREQERRDPPRERKQYNNERRDNGERREYNNNRRDYGDRRNNDRNLDRPRRDDRDFDRTNRNEGNNRTENRPRYEEKRGDDTRERRAPLAWTKISSITPGEDSLNIIVRVVSAQRVGARFRCVLGDETGITNAFLPESEFLHEGENIVLFSARSEVVKQHIEIQLDRRGRIEKSRRDVKSVNEEFNLSHKAWVPIE